MRQVAIVGAGIGAQHLEGYLKLPERFCVTHLCDTNIARAEGLLQPGTDIKIMPDFNAVLADPNVEIVDICLPPHLHFQAVMDALSAGKTVVCEKPLVPSLAEVDLLEQKVHETGRLIFPVFQYRYGIGMAQLLALQEAGIAGRCFAGSLETHWDRPRAYYDENTWRGTWAGENGGALLGHAIHIHDLLAAVLGPLQQVFADVATRVNGIEVEDCAALSLRSQDGAVVTSSVTLGAAGNTSRMRLMFEGFTVESDHAPYSLAEKPWQFIARAPIQQAQIDEVLQGVEAPAAGYSGLFGAMADALDGKPSRAVTLQDARQSLELVTACYHSARVNAPVILPLQPSHPLYTGWAPVTG